MASGKYPAYALLYVAVRGYVFFMSLLPVTTARAITKALGRVVLQLMPRLHRVGKEQLDLAYGDTLSDEEKRQILHEAMDNLAIVAAEFAHGPRLAAAGFPNVSVRGFEHFDPDRAAVIFSGHLANWELMASIYGAHSRTLAEVVRPLGFPPMNAFVDRMRRAMGATTVPKFAASKELLRLLETGTDVGILIDQSPRDTAVPVTFFGRECWATVGAVMLAQRANVPMHFFGMHRKPDHSYEVEISPAITFVNTGRKLEDLQTNTQACQDVLEEFIRRYPGQWLWFHRRWKRRPRLEKEWAARLAKDREVKADEAERFES